MTQKIDDKRQKMNVIIFKIWNIYVFVEYCDVLDASMFLNIHNHVGAIKTPIHHFLDHKRNSSLYNLWNSWD